jgi:hypothetical protein
MARRYRDAGLGRPGGSLACISASAVSGCFLASHALAAASRSRPMAAVSDRPPLASRKQRGQRLLTGVMG